MGSGLSRFRGIAATTSHHAPQVSNSSGKTRGVVSGEGFPSELLHSHKSCRSACQDRGFLLSSEKMQVDSGGVFRRLRQNVVCVACTKVWRGCRYLRGPGNCGTPESGGGVGAARRNQAGLSCPAAHGEERMLELELLSLVSGWGRGSCAEWGFFK